MILFCLPYAGGAETMYYKWKSFLSPSIQLCPIELKGRGKRYSEDFYEGLEDAVEDIFTSIRKKISNNDYAIFGHSMGGLLAFELYYKIERMGIRPPKHIFFSAYGAPSALKDTEITYNLPDNEFIQKIFDLGGTPKELVENKELFELFLPILKSDIKLVETYNYRERESKINCDISVLVGDQDSLGENEIMQWEVHTSQKCNKHFFSGNHFFINDNTEKITSIIKETMLKKRF